MEWFLSFHSNECPTMFQFEEARACTDRNPRWTDQRYVHVNPCKICPNNHLTNLNCDGQRIRFDADKKKLKFRQKNELVRYENR